MSCWCNDGASRDMLLVALCCRIWDKHWPYGPLNSYVNIVLPLSKLRCLFCSKILTRDNVSSSWWNKPVVCLYLYPCMLIWSRSKPCLFKSFSFNSEFWALFLLSICPSQLSNVVVNCLNPFFKVDCKSGRILNTDDFKFLARKVSLIPLYLLSLSLSTVRSGGTVWYAVQGGSNF